MWCCYLNIFWIKHILCISKNLTLHQMCSSNQDCLMSLLQSKQYMEKPDKIHWTLAQFWMSLHIRCNHSTLTSAWYLTLLAICCHHETPLSWEIYTMNVFLDEKIWKWIDCAGPLSWPSAHKENHLRREIDYPVLRERPANQCGCWGNRCCNRPHRWQTLALTYLWTGDTVLLWGVLQATGHQFYWQENWMVLAYFLSAKSPFNQTVARLLFKQQSIKDCFCFCFAHGCLP